MGPAEKAMEVYIHHYRFGDFIIPVDEMDYNFTVVKRNFKHDNPVFIMRYIMLGHQFFVVNDDKTISPTNSPHFVLCYNNGHLRICNRGTEGQLVFEYVKPSYIRSLYMKLTLKSHPGKGIVFNGQN